MESALGATPLLWGMTIALIVALLAFDYFFHVRQAHPLSSSTSEVRANSGSSSSCYSRLTRCTSAIRAPSRAHGDTRPEVRR